MVSSPSRWCGASILGKFHFNARFFDDSFHFVCHVVEVGAVTFGLEFNVPSVNFHCKLFFLLFVNDELIFFRSLIIVSLVPCLAQCAHHLFQHGFGVFRPHDTTGGPRGVGPCSDYPVHVLPVGDPRGLQDLYPGVDALDGGGGCGDVLLVTCLARAYQLGWFRDYDVGR